MVAFRTTIIAEAGVNHNGNIENAKKLIDVASSAGADFVKFQTFNPQALVTKEAGLANYQRNSKDFSKQLQMLEKLSLSDEEHLELVKHCELRGIQPSVPVSTMLVLTFCLVLVRNYTRFPLRDKQYTILRIDWCTR